MSTTSIEEERQRKRLRKGTFSCWECKRRKVRCKYEDDQSSICTGCSTRGTACLSQEYPEDHKSLPENNSNVGDRLARVEKILEKLVNKIGTTESGRVAAAEALESLGIDVLHESTEHENAPVYSLFDNAVFGRDRNDEEKTSSASTPTPMSLQEHTANNTPSKLETTTRYLVAMLPKQETVDLIVEAGHNWWIVKKHSKPIIDQHLLGLYPVQKLSRRHPIIVARALLYLVISVQQLPSSFDRSQLDFSTTEFMERIHASVSSRVLMDDELVGSVEGIETLLLEGIYHINAARPRSAWLLMRRAISICQLLGIHRRSGRAARDNKSMSASYLEEVWSLAVGADRYIALLLGLPYGVADTQYEYDVEVSHTVEEKYQRKMVAITAEVIDWNSGIPDFEHAQDLDRRIDELAGTMPQEWWRLPSTPTSPLASLGFGRTQNSSAAFDRLMAQLWHYQMKALLHLPFMLRSEPRYERSIAMCLDACRELILRYIFFRKSNEGCFCCKIVDFQAFTAATTLLLDLLGSGSGSGKSEHQQQKDVNWKLVQDVTKILEDLSKKTPQNPNPDNLVATQGLKVLKALQADLGGGGSTMRLVIPYFGTVTISRSLRSPVSSFRGSQQTPIVPSNHTQNSELNSNSQSIQYQQQHQYPQGMFNIQHEPYLTQQNYGQHYPTVSFANDNFPRAAPEHESLWGDWLMQDRNDVPFQNMFDPNLGTSWYLQGMQDQT